jgi:hypothetical protein
VEIHEICLEVIVWNWLEIGETSRLLRDEKKAEAGWRMADISYCVGLLRSAAAST